MLEDFSCGVIPYRLVDGQRQFLLVQHKAGHWAFPKGHPEVGETHLQTARRELAEETGLADVAIDQSRFFEETYLFTKRSGKQVRKRVVYYLGKVQAKAVVRLQACEVSDSAWGSAQQTHKRMSFDEGKALLDRVLDYLDASRPDAL